MKKYLPTYKDFVAVFLSSFFVLALDLQGILAVVVVCIVGVWVYTR
jgi:hypothetical protein